MSIETPSNEELGQRMKTQIAVASEMLGFDVSDPKEQTPEHEARFLKWINENGLYFKDVLERNPDIWERVSKGEARIDDVLWIITQISDDFDTGAEDHESEREFDA
jgi:hypothetical protein